MMALLGWIVPGMAALGSALLTLALLGVLGNLARSVLRLQLHRVRSLRRGPAPQPRGVRIRWSRQKAVWLAGGAALAVLARDPILSPWLLALGVALAAWSRETGGGRALRSHSVLLIRRLRSHLRGSVSNALAEAARGLPEGDVRARAEAVGRDHATGIAWEGAVRRLLGLHPLLDRLALLLAAAGRMREEHLRGALAALDEESAERERAASVVGGEIVLLKVTVRFLLAANVVAATAALLVPAWRDFYVSSIARRGTFIAATLMAAGALVYFSEEIRALEEMV